MKTTTKGSLARRFLSGMLTAAMAAALLVPASAYAKPADETVLDMTQVTVEEAETTEAEEQDEALAVDLYGEDPIFTANDVVSVKATTSPNFYGQRLYTIEVVFKDRTDMTGAARPESYGVWDRSINDGKFERGIPEKVLVNKYTAKLFFDQGPAATGDYTSDPFGMLCTASWNYADLDYDGVYDSMVNTELRGQYKAGDAMYDAYGGYQTRDNLDLVLQLGTEIKEPEDAYSMPEGIALTDGFGNKVEGTVWEDTVNLIYDDFTLEYLDIAQTPSKYSQFGGKIPFYYYVPDSYDEEAGIPLVVYITGSGTSYYEKKDAEGNLLASNRGTDMSYDNCMAAWAQLSQDADPRNDVIAATLDVYSSDNPSAGKELADAIALMKTRYNITTVILEGNSNGTSVCSCAIEEAPELIDVFICNNGCIAQRRNTAVKDNAELPVASSEYDWSEDEIWRVAKNGIAFWVLNGERDNMADPTYALKSIEQLIPYYKAAGWSDEWIADNIRVSFYKDYKFKEWGVSNHSCVKVTSWYYLDKVYEDIYLDSASLIEGDSYYMSDPIKEGRSAFLLPLDEFTFTVYGNSVSKWAVSRGEEYVAGDIKADAIESIQAYTDMCFYGQKLTKVVIKYAAGTDLTGLTAADYAIWDRGYANPSFVQADIETAVVDSDASTVTLCVTTDTERTGERSKNPVGTLASGAWYIDFNNVVHFGNGSVSDPVTGEEFAAVESGKGYFTRKNLDLVLAAKGQDIGEGIPMTDGHGNMLLGSRWKAAVNNKYDAFEVVKVPGAAVESRYVVYDGNIPVMVSIPEGYADKESWPLVCYITGSGTSYWELYNEDGTVKANNPGTNLAFDNAAAGWIEDAIVISPDVYSNDNVNAGKDVATAIQYMIDNYNVDLDHVIIEGNSNGTVICSEVLRQYPGLVDVFISNNGRVGNRPGNTASVDGKLENSSLGQWTEEERASLAANNVRIWTFNGETDSAHPRITQDGHDHLVALYKAAGFDDEWIANNLRISGYPSWKFKYWGETDHSCTKMTFWYYLDQPYNDPYREGAALEPGSVYRFPGQEDTNYYGADEYDYYVYADSVKAWALGDAADDDVLAGFVKRLYRTFLGREADEKGLNAWVEALKNGKGTASQVVCGFVFSKEFQENPLSDEGFIAAMYNVIFNRDADEKGLAAWMKVLEDGATRKKVLEGFLNSKELGLLCVGLGIEQGDYKSDEIVDGNLAATAFVTRLYKNYLGRRPDMNGLTAWITALVTKDATGSKVAANFFQSREFDAMNLSDENFVRAAYITILGREADEAGFVNWVGVLKNGGSRDDIVKGFVKSAEFANLCTSFGIEP